MGPDASTLLQDAAKFIVGKTFYLWGGVEQQVQLKCTILEFQTQKFIQEQTGRHSLKLFVVPMSIPIHACSYQLFFWHQVPQQLQLHVHINCGSQGGLSRTCIQQQRLQLHHKHCPYLDPHLTTYIDAQSISMTPLPDQKHLCLQPIPIILTQTVLCLQLSNHIELYYIIHFTYHVHIAVTILSNPYLSLMNGYIAPFTRTYWLQLNWFGKRSSSVHTQSAKPAYVNRFKRLHVNSLYSYKF